MKKQMRQAGFLFIFFISQKTDEATFSSLKKTDEGYSKQMREGLRNNSLFFLSD